MLSDLKSCFLQMTPEKRKNEYRGRLKGTLVGLNALLAKKGFLDIYPERILTVSKEINMIFQRNRNSELH